MTDTTGPTPGQAPEDEHRVAEHGVSEHEHEGDGGEHETVEHGDHVDFVHDGHRHARHEDHYDEH
ncbi:zinc transporter permease [Curtobacterium sp. MCBD17_021]|uniref:zinc transporter permease n=1 Tax=Curtobacterium sp. MCBD17_021 TaxID=2175665 RepID=UPI000DAA8E93|nr:zinc transporter permease [Curtobacterium sp. MCBD17_021]PZE68854.1 zinc transporter permease [Curtobacterium sp. MCBD17_021]